MIITIARKPVSESTVAANILKHKTGALNIDASRIGSQVLESEKRTSKSGDSKFFGLPGDGGERHNSDGRWPANFILQHREGCRCEGTKRVKSSTQGHGVSLPYGSETTWSVSKTEDNQRNRWHADEDGKETIPNWVCVEGCPIAELDKQSGIVPTGAWVRLKEAHKYYNQKEKEIGDCKEWKTVVEPAGGASRYFKQVK